MTIPTISLKTESLLLILALVPIAYFCWIWSTIPETVPIHWNFQGEADDYGSKQVLFGILCGLNVFMYLFMLLLPRIAARSKELKAMGGKYNRVRLVLQLFIAALSIIITLMVSGQVNGYKDYLLGGCMLLFMLLFGNYVGSIRPNYFMGVRTPWTLQSNEVWRKTHRLTGRLLLGGAVLGIILLGLLPPSWRLLSVIVLMLAAFLIPAIYSFFLFQKETTTES